MENNKYYTPSLEELHIGFICESQFKTINQAWKIKVCDSDLLTIAYNEFEHAEEDEPFSEQFRVKYLDKQDIESCGWESQLVLDIEDNECTNHIEGYNKNLNSTDNIDIVPLGNNKYSIQFSHEYNEHSGNCDLKQLFRGTIKNLSEFKRLLKQLNIE